MRRILISSFALALVAGMFAGCQPPPPPAPTVDLAAAEQAIKDASAKWLQLRQAKDTAGIMSEMVAPDAVTLFGGEVHKGAAEIQASMEKEIAENPDATLTWATTGVTVAASGDLGYELGTWTYDPDGAGEKPAENGEFVTIWKKTDAGWRMVVDSGTVIKPAEEAPATE